MHASADKYALFSSPMNGWREEKIPGGSATLLGGQTQAGDTPATAEERAQRLAPLRFIISRSSLLRPFYGGGFVFADKTD